MRKYFWSDDLDHKDWLLLWSTIIFFGFVAVGLISILLGVPIDENYIELLKMVSQVIMVIVTGVFGVNFATEIRKPKEVEKVDTTNSDFPQVREKREYFDEEGRL